MSMKTEQFVRRKTGRRAKVVVRRRTGGWVAEPKTDSTADASKKPPRILEKSAEPEKAENPSEPAKEPLAPQSEDIIKAKDVAKPEDSGENAAEESALPPGEIPDIGELSKSCENGTKHVYIAKKRKSGKL